MEDQVRVLRVIEYVGDRSAVEACVKASIHGEVEVKGRGYTIRAATIGTYPELLTKGEERQDG